MKGKLPKKKQMIKAQSDEEIKQSQEISVQQQKQQKAVFDLKNIRKEALLVTFTGMIENGSFQEYDSLTLFYSIVNGSDWIKISGQKNAVSQIAGSNGKNITWNLPFQISYETTYISGWPQLVLALYGTDFFGRSFVRGYGNVHLPTTTGKHRRKVRIFQLLPQSTISGIFGFISGVVAEYKDHDKILTSGQGREVTRVKSIGEVYVNIEIMKHNFRKYGYE